MMVLTPESLVRRCYEADCFQTETGFGILADQELLGFGSSPKLAWQDAAQNLPDMLCKNYHCVHQHNDVFYIRSPN